MNLQNIPPELVLMIYHKLNIRDLFKLISCCRYFWHIYHIDTLDRYVVGSLYNCNGCVDGFNENICGNYHGIKAAILHGYRLQENKLLIYNRGIITNKYPIISVDRYYIRDCFTYKFTIRDYQLHGDFIIYNRELFINIIHYDYGKVVYKVVIEVDHSIYIETNKINAYDIVDDVGIESNILSLQDKTGVSQITLDGKIYNVNQDIIAE